VASDPKETCPWGNVPADECPSLTTSTVDPDHVRWHLIKLEEEGILETLPDGIGRLTEKGIAYFKTR
jgi:hypothetical protein